MNTKSFGVFLFFAISALFVIIPSAFATTFDLVPPSGALSRGQNITFTININTEGVAVTSIQSGLTYDATLLQYVSVTAGAAMSSVVADTTTYGTGKVLFTGTNNTGYNGTGVFATVVFTIIAQSSGSTEICTLWRPEITPTPTPIPVLSPTPAPICGSVCTTNAQCPGDMPCYIVAGQTSGYCRRAACPEINSCICPAPTALPVTGSTDTRNTAVGTAVGLFVAATGIFLFSQKSKYTPPHEVHEAKNKLHRHTKATELKK